MNETLRKSKIKNSTIKAGVSFTTSGGRGMLLKIFNENPAGFVFLITFGRVNYGLFTEIIRYGQNGIGTIGGCLCR